MLWSDVSEPILPSVGEATVVDRWLINGEGFVSAFALVYFLNFIQAGVEREGIFFLREFHNLVY